MRAMIVLLGLAVIPVAMPMAALGDQCVGSVVMGRCYGSVLPDYSNPGARPDNLFRNDGQGFHVRSNPGPAFEGYKFHNYSDPVITNHGLRWADPNELSDG